ncbi:speckle-type POZ protein B [Trichonephila clavata]|uniref:Speckle-type POZ protein B n=1 Tax=Trichonephila clavata TaxID=2740835 RepID=A0A8X6M260_TRICU|nr:speckle-type POZ protein B [Trichonephila clavata]
MATLDYGIKSTCTFLWKIENFNYLWMKYSQRIESPVFVVDGLENTEWVVRLYPRGNWFADRIEFFLHRKNDRSCTDDIDVYFELEFLSGSGKTVCSHRGEKQTLSKCSYPGFYSTLCREEVFVRNKSEYLPLNTLSARCKIWRCDGKDAVDKYFLAETRVAVQRRSFHWQIENFSTIGCNDTKHLVIRSITNQILMTFDLYFTGGQLGKEVIDIGIRVFKPNAKYLTFKAFVLNSNGSFTNCGMEEFLWEGCKEKRTLTLLLSKKQLQSTEHGLEKYLKNDILTFYCECIFSTGIASEKIESVNSGIDSLVGLKERGLSTDDEISVIVLPTDDAASLREDLGSLCFCDDFSDTKLRTNTTTIPVHTPILGARSSVFRAMFSTDMKEKTQGCVDVADLDDDTVRRMLLYVYTDKLEDLQWESASQLYVASDKYDIVSLRSKCSAILQAKLSPTNACQILYLANLHQDESLKKLYRSTFSSKVKQFLVLRNGNFSWKLIFV